MIKSKFIVENCAFRFNMNTLIKKSFSQIILNAQILLEKILIIRMNEHSIGL